MRILCARHFRYLRTQYPPTLIRRRVLDATLGANNRLGGGSHDNQNQNDNRSIGRRTHAHRTTSALAADIVSKAPRKVVEAAPTSCFDLAFGGGIQSDYNFRGISQTDKGPGVYAYVEPRCNITKDIQLYAGMWGWSTKLPTAPTGEFDIYGGIRPDLRPDRVRFRRHVLLLSERDPAVLRRPALTHGQPIELRLRPVHGERHRHVGGLRQDHLDRDGLARDRRLRLLHAELAGHVARTAPTPAAT